MSSCLHVSVMRHSLVGILEHGSNSIPSSVFPFFYFHIKFPGGWSWRSSPVHSLMLSFHSCLCLLLLLLQCTVPWKMVFEWSMPHGPTSPAPCRDNCEPVPDADNRLPMRHRVIFCMNSSSCHLSLTPLCSPAVCVQVLHAYRSTHDWCILPYFRPRWFPCW